MYMNALPSEQIAVVAAVAPGALTAAAYNSGYIDLSLYRQLMAIISVGAWGASATLDAKWQLADDSSGTNVADAPTTKLTQVLAASGSNVQAVLNFSSDEVATGGAAKTGQRWARLVVTVGVATTGLGAVVLGFGARSEPATQPAAVVQVVGY